MKLEDAKVTPLVTNLTAHTPGPDKAVCLQWTFPEAADHYLIYSHQGGGDPDHRRWSLLGATSTTCFQTVPPQEPCTVLYKVQPVLASGFATPLDLCASVEHAVNA